MFSGIIQAIGTVKSLSEQGGDQRITVAVGKLSTADVTVGDSIAVNGVCLTVIELKSDLFSADVSNETLDKTTLGNLALGSRVNLEKALTPATYMGGHMVLGHVDGMVRVLLRSVDARSVLLHIAVPTALTRYIATKGSITVDGVSLTVNAVEATAFSLNLVPYTLAETTLDTLQPDDMVNLEGDIIARYLERLLMPESEQNSHSPESDFLLKYGYIRADRFREGGK